MAATEIIGRCSNAKTYAFESIGEMWRTFKQMKCESQSESSWYNESARYWANTPDTVDGVMGGLSRLHNMDIQFSKHFLDNIKLKTHDRAADCGCGIGRISKDLLLSKFAAVDLIEQCDKFLLNAQHTLPPHIGDYICCGLQNIKFPPVCYDCIWIQWVVGSLTDNDFISFLCKCKAALTPQGCIVVKENVNVEWSEKTLNGGFFYDHKDNSIVRTKSHFDSIFEQANLKICHEAIQSGFPKSLFPVRMYALR